MSLLSGFLLVLALSVLETFVVYLFIPLPTSLIIGAGLAGITGWIIGCHADPMNVNS